MKKYFTLLMLAVAPTMMMAQDSNEGSKERFNPEVHKERQHQFMMEKAQLTKDDSIKFFAIYDEMRMKEREIYGDSHEMRMKRPESDAECRAAMIHADSLDLAIKQLQYDYHMRLLDAISPKKAVMAVMAGEDFDRMTFREMMRDWRHDNRIGKSGDKAKADKNTKSGKNIKKGSNNHRRDFNEPRPEGPIPEGPGFHGGHPGDPTMDGGPGLDGPRPDGPMPDGPAPKDSKESDQKDSTTK